MFTLLKFDYRINSSRHNNERKIADDYSLPARSKISIIRHLIMMFIHSQRYPARLFHSLLSRSSSNWLTRITECCRSAGHWKGTRSKWEVVHPGAHIAHPVPAVWIIKYAFKRVIEQFSNVDFFVKYDTYPVPTKRYHIFFQMQYESVFHAKGVLSPLQFLIDLHNNWKYAVYSAKLAK